DEKVCCGSRILDGSKYRCGNQTDQCTSRAVKQIVVRPNKRKIICSSRSQIWAKDCGQTCTCKHTNNLVPVLDKTRFIEKDPRTEDTSHTCDNPVNWIDDIWKSCLC